MMDSNQPLGKNTENSLEAPNQDSTVQDEALNALQNFVDQQRAKGSEVLKNSAINGKAPTDHLLALNENTEPPVAAADNIDTQNQELDKLWSEVTTQKTADSTQQFISRLAEITRERLIDARDKVNPETLAKLKSQSKAVFERSGLGQNLLLLDLLGKEIKQTLLNDKMQTSLSHLETAGQDPKAFDSLLRQAATIPLENPEQDQEHLNKAIENNLKCLFLNTDARTKLNESEQQLLTNREAAFKAIFSGADISKLEPLYAEAIKWLGERKLAGTDNAADFPLLSDNNADVNVDNVNAKSDGSHGTEKQKPVVPSDNSLPKVDLHLEPQSASWLYRNFKMGTGLVIGTGISVAAMGFGFLFTKTGRSFLAGGIKRVVKGEDAGYEAKKTFNTKFQEWKSTALYADASFKASLKGSSAANYGDVLTKLSPLAPGPNAPGGSVWIAIQSEMSARASGDPNPKNETPEQLVNRMCKFSRRGGFRTYALAFGTLLGGEHAEASMANPANNDNPAAPTRPALPEISIFDSLSNNNQSEPARSNILPAESANLVERDSVASNTLGESANQARTSAISAERQNELLTPLLKDLRRQRAAATQAGNTKSVEGLDAEIKEFEHINPLRREAANKRFGEYLSARGNLAAGAGGSMVLAGLGLGYMNYLKRKEINNERNSTSRSVPVVGK
jgi:hypothetical protein